MWLLASREKRQRAQNSITLRTSQPLSSSLTFSYVALLSWLLRPLSSHLISFLSLLTRTSWATANYGTYFLALALMYVHCIVVCKILWLLS